MNFFFVLGVALALSFSAAASELDNNQVLALEFEEQHGATTFIDSSYAGNNATCAATACPTLEFGGVHQFSNFDGTNDVATVTNNANLNFGTTDFTVSAWILIESTAVREGIIDKAGSANDGYILWIANADAQRIGFIRGCLIANEVMPAADHLVAFRWHHIVAAVDTAPVTDTVTLYDNGAALITGNLAFTATSTTALTIGGTNGTDGAASAVGFFDGYIDYVRVFKIKLTRQEVQAVYHTDRWEMRWKPVFDDARFGRFGFEKIRLRSWSIWPLFL